MVKSFVSNVTNFQPLLAFTTGHIPTKLHQFVVSGFRDFLRTVTQTPEKPYLLAACAHV